MEVTIMNVDDFQELGLSGLEIRTLETIREESQQETFDRLKVDVEIGDTKDRSRVKNLYITTVDGDLVSIVDLDYQYLGKTHKKDPTNCDVCGNQIKYRHKVRFGPDVDLIVGKTCVKQIESFLEQIMPEKYANSRSREAQQQRQDEKMFDLSYVTTSTESGLVAIGEKILKKAKRGVSKLKGLLNILKEEKESGKVKRLKATVLSLQEQIAQNLDVLHEFYGGIALDKPDFSVAARALEPVGSRLNWLRRAELPDHLRQYLKELDNPHVTVEPWKLLKLNQYYMENRTDHRGAITNNLEHDLHLLLHAKKSQAFELNDYIIRAQRRITHQRSKDLTPAGELTLQYEADALKTLSRLDPQTTHSFVRMNGWLKLKKLPDIFHKEAISRREAQQLEEAMGGIATREMMNDCIDANYSFSLGNFLEWAIPVWKEKGFTRKDTATLRPFFDCLDNTVEVLEKRFRNYETFEDMEKRDPELADRYFALWDDLQYTKEQVKGPSIDEGLKLLNIGRGNRTIRRAFSVKDYMTFVKTALLVDRKRDAGYLDSNDYLIPEAIEHQGKSVYDMFRLVTIALPELEGKDKLAYTLFHKNYKEEFEKANEIGLITTKGLQALIKIYTALGGYDTVDHILAETRGKADQAQEIFFAPTWYKPGHAVSPEKVEEAKRKYQDATLALKAFKNAEEELSDFLTDGSQEVIEELEKAERGFTKISISGYRKADRDFVTETLGLRDFDAETLTRFSYGVRARGQRRFLNLRRQIQEEAPHLKLTVEKDFDAEKLYKTDQDVIHESSQRFYDSMEDDQTYHLIIFRNRPDLSRKARRFLGTNVWSRMKRQGFDSESGFMLYRNADKQFIEEICQRLRQDNVTYNEFCEMSLLTNQQLEQRLTQAS
jgi:hypothetical protein